MKSIAIIVDSDLILAEFLTKNLRMVLKDEVKINIYFFDKIEENVILEEDVVLFMTRYRAISGKKCVKNSESIIIINRTFLESDIDKIMEIPKNSKVLVVNDTQETILGMASLLYRLGINNLDFIPYKSNREYDDVKYAITPNLIKHVPSYIEKIINIGNRYIDISTFIEIINKLNINDKEISKNLIDYSNKIITLNSGIKDSYEELFLKCEELDTVINLSNEGILLTNNKDIIQLYNKSFVNMFRVKGDIDQCNINDFFGHNLSKVILKENISEELIQFNEKYIIVNKTSINYTGKQNYYYYNFQEVTYIKQLEQKFTAKLKSKGLVARYVFDDIKTQSPVMKKCIELGKKVSKSELTVLIVGESGTGKELIAQSIHNNSTRENHPFVAVNCASINNSLLESELFGYEEGAFTGALKGGKVGLFELANNGTIFLDEIGDIPLSFQTRLLRIIQEKQVMRIGSQRLININVRVICATNIDLIQSVREGKFRRDLFYRLNVLPINVPSLKDRREDILHLFNYYMKPCENYILDEEVKSILTNYGWPGNVRELQNIVSYIKLMNEKIINIDSLPYYLVYKQSSFEEEIYEIEKKYDIYIVLTIMIFIKEYNELKISIGRTKILALILNKGQNTNESEVRRILLLLSDMHMIKVFPGRRGTEITDKGIRFINWATNWIKKQPNTPIK